MQKSRWVPTCTRTTRRARRWGGCRCAARATLCAAYAEEQVDHILELLHRIEPFDDKTRNAPIEQRLARASAIVQRLASDELFELERTLAAGAALFGRRDEIVHGRLYPGLERSDALQAAKPKVTQRPAAAQELYALANEFAVYRDALVRPQVMRLPRAAAGAEASRSGAASARGVDADATCRARERARWMRQSS